MAKNISPVLAACLENELGPFVFLVKDDIKTIDKLTTYFIIYKLQCFGYD